MISRRSLIAAGGGSLLLAGCDALNTAPAFRSVLTSAEKLTMGAQRLITDRTALAREFSAADMSPVFRANGTRMPDSAAYRALLANSFADYALEVTGLVARPLRLSLAQLLALPARTQITRHDCVEGWSAIGQWSGPQLGPILKAAGLMPAAAYLVFHCADAPRGYAYYESVDLIDAFHPQTILALRLNGRPLPVENGAPVRLRVERQLGYKHAKYVMRIEAVSSLKPIHGGKGGFWEDRLDYAWYAGI
jgi:DMSO/TMAO reductase YedYZ molybdopterin-dependent catalytic subunit